MTGDLQRFLRRVDVLTDHELGISIRLIRRWEPSHVAPFWVLCDCGFSTWDRAAWLAHTKTRCTPMYFKTTGIS